MFGAGTAQLGLPVLKNGAGHVLIPSSMYEQLALKLGAGPKVPGLTWATWTFLGTLVT